MDKLPADWFQAEIPLLALGLFPVLPYTSCRALQGRRVHSSRGKTHQGRNMQEADTTHLTRNRHNQCGPRTESSSGSDSSETEEGRSFKRIRLQQAMRSFQWLMLFEQILTSCWFIKIHLFENSLESKTFSCNYSDRQPARYKSIWIILWQIDKCCKVKYLHVLHLS